MKKKKGETGKEIENKEKSKIEKVKSRKIFLIHK